MDRKESLEKLSRCILCESENIKEYCQISDINLCNHCGLFFDNPRPTIAAIKDYYSKNDQYDIWLQDLIPREELWKNRLQIVKKYISRNL